MGLDIYHYKLSPVQQFEVSEETVDDSYHYCGSVRLYELAKEKLKTQSFAEVFNEEGNIFVDDNLELYLSDYLFIEHIKSLELKNQCRYLITSKKEFVSLFATLENIFSGSGLNLSDIHYSGFGCENFDYAFRVHSSPKNLSIIHDLVEKNLICEVDNDVYPDEIYIHINMDVIREYSSFIHEDIYYVDALEIGYQRKGFNADLEFYKKYYGECWYVTKDVSVDEEIYKKMPYCFDNKDLKLISKTFLKNTPIRKWKLQEDEFIYFSS